MVLVFGDLYQFSKILFRRMLVLPELLLNYTDYFQPLNLFNYITFRTIGALLTALLITIFGPFIISLLKKLKRKVNQFELMDPRIILSLKLELQLWEDY